MILAVMDAILVFQNYPYILSFTIFNIFLVLEYSTYSGAGAGAGAGVGVGIHHALFIVYLCVREDSYFYFLFLCTLLTRKLNPRSLLFPPVFPDFPAPRGTHILFQPSRLPASALDHSANKTHFRYFDERKDLLWDLSARHD